jgi:hypothetical protein
MNILIDTNIVLPLEPGSTVDLEVNTNNAVLFHSLSSQSNNVICVHPAIEYDLARDKNQERANLRRTLIGRYKTLPSPPPPSCLDSEDVGTPEFGSNDYVDNCYLAAVKDNAVDFLITEDKGVHRKARKLGIESRVLLLKEAIDLLRNLFDESPPPPPSVEKIYVHELDTSDEILSSLRKDYDPNFDSWLIKCKREHREAYIIRTEDTSQLAGILIIKREEQLPSGDSGKTLKLCTFKVSDKYGGNRYGELLLKSAFDYAYLNKYKYIYFTTYQKQEGLIAFASSFGFEISKSYNERGESILYKEFEYSNDQLNTLSALEFHIRFGPRAFMFDKNSTFVVPIVPKFHGILFPELEKQIPLFRNYRPCGNSIKKAYLCHSTTKLLNPGDNLLIYRSHDLSGITAIGVVEETLRSQDPNEITRFVGTRTVYPYSEIVELCKKPTLAVKFRYAQRFNKPLILKDLKKHRVLKGAPQSISRLQDEGLSWIKEKIET